MRAVLCGYYGKGNLGDEALLATLLQMLPPEITPIVLSGNPSATQTQYNVEACDRNSPWAIVQALRSADAFIFGGGSLIQDVTSQLSPLYYCGLMGLAQRLGLQGVAWAQGVGPLQRPLTRWFARLAFQQCYGVSVRDGGSAKLLSDWQVPCLLAPDPVWAMAALPGPDLSDLPEPRIAVSLRPSPWLTPERLTCLTQALALLQAQMQASVILLPLQPSQDAAIAQQLQQALCGPNRLLTLTDPRELKGIFRQIQLTISMRLHGLIMAAAEGSNCFALSYDPKVTQLMAETEIPGWELPALPLAADAIAQRWLECYTKQSRLSEQRIQSLRDRALMHQEVLLQLLTKRF